MSRVVRMAALSLALSGCGMDVEPETQSADQSEIRLLLLCQQGLGDRIMESDKGLFDLCERVEDEGYELVRDGEHAAFGALDDDGAYRALFNALDTNGDRRVDNRDERTAIHLVGFSWGGVNITRVAKKLKKDDRVAFYRSGVMAMVLLDPFQPHYWSLTIPDNVYRAWIYRQTETTESDCSTRASFGWGFRGLSPRKGSELGFCTDYDLDAFKDDVGHCDVVRVAADAAFENLTTRREYEAWDDHASDCPDAD